MLDLHILLMTLHTLSSVRLGGEMTKNYSNMSKIQSTFRAMDRRRGPKG